VQNQAASSENGSTGCPAPVRFDPGTTRYPGRMSHIFTPMYGLW